MRKNGRFLGSYSGTNGREEGTGPVLTFLWGRDERLPIRSLNLARACLIRMRDLYDDMIAMDVI